jgi:hypothetical protein
VNPTARRRPSAVSAFWLRRDLGMHLDAAPLRAWVLTVYGLLVGTLAGFGFGYGAWRLLGRQSEAFCLALTTGGSRCTGGPSPENWTLIGGAVGAGFGLSIAVAGWTALCHRTSRSHCLHC